jgi:hypothetical protein
MAGRTVTTSTVRAVAIATKWARLPEIVKKDAKKDTDISVLKVAATTMARAVIAKRAADVGEKKVRPQAMARVAMPRKVRDTCVVKDRPVVMARHEKATKTLAIVVQTARRMATDHTLTKMALMASTILMATDHLIRPAPARIRKRAATRPTPLCNSLVSTRGARLLVPANTLPGLL